MATATPVNDTNFQSVVLDSEQTVLVDFWAPWCGPCRAVGPIVDQMASERTDVLVVKVNVDESPQTAAQFRIMSIPHLMVFRAGLPVREMRGAAKRDVIERMLQA